ncbi:hypothetical protein CKO09_05335 [Chromatium weissei]|nr:hypothetical protein [Chromatium weissei]
MKNFCVNKSTITRIFSKEIWFNCISQWRDWLFGATLLTLLLAAVQFAIGWPTLLAPWRELSPWLLAWLFTLTAFSYGLRAIRIADYFRPQFAGKLIGLLRLTIFHNVANNLLPMRSGELVFPWLMRRYFGYEIIESAAALIWIRLFDLHFIILIAIVIFNLRQPSWVWWMLATIWIAGLTLLKFFNELHLLSQLRGAGRIRTLIRKAVQTAPNQLSLIARVYLWTALIWSLKFAAFVSLLRFFLPLDHWQLLTGVMGAELSSVLPFHGIAGSGSYELAAVSALMPLGIEPKLALAGAVNLHLFLLGSTLILGVLAFILNKPSLND